MFSLIIKHVCCLRQLNQFGFCFYKKISSEASASNNLFLYLFLFVFCFGISKNTVFTLGPVSSNIYRPTINSTGPNLKTALMTISSNHQNSKLDDVPNIMWTCICQLWIIVG